MCNITCSVLGLRLGVGGGGGGGHYQENNEKTVFIWKEIGFWQSELKELAKKQAWHTWTCSIMKAQTAFISFGYLTNTKRARTDLLDPVLSSGLQSSKSVGKGDCTLSCLTMWPFFISGAPKLYLQDKAETSLLPFSILGYGNSCSTFFSLSLEDEQV